jgi:hypothetical protein
MYINPVYLSLTDKITCMKLKTVVFLVSIISCIWNYATAQNELNYKVDLLNEKGESLIVDDSLLKIESLREAKEITCVIKDAAGKTPPIYRLHVMISTKNSGIKDYAFQSLKLPQQIILDLKMVSKGSLILDYEKKNKELVVLTRYKIIP